MNDWKWFGHPGHFICGRDCVFHLCTQIGDYLVSTVGEYWADQEVRRIHAKIHDAKWFKENSRLKGDDFDSAYMKRFGYEEIGHARKYETMVFKVTGKVCADPGCNCGIPTIVADELDFAGYNNAGDATRGHYEICERWKNGVPDELKTTEPSTTV